MEKETMVATVPQAEIVDEQQLSRDVTDIEFRAESLVIQTDEDYAFAGEFGKMLKKKASQVTTFFKPMKDSAYQAHKAVCDREKAMLTPLRNAEKTVKQVMSAYIAEQERKRREAEEAARRAAEAERERKIQEAATLEAAGDADGAEAAFEEAAIMDDAASYAVVPAAATRRSPASAPRKTGKSSRSTPRRSRWRWRALSSARSIRPLLCASSVPRRARSKFPASPTVRSQK